MYRMAVILILSGVFFSLKSQEILPVSRLKSETEIMDSITYCQYLNREYKNLIKTANVARNKGIDNYYLNYRTAIAYYELKNYAKAAEFYKKTLAETPNDAVLLESLYYAYLRSGQKINAAIIGAQLSPDRHAVIGYKSSAIDYVSLSGGYSFSGNDERVRNSAAVDSINQYQDMYYGSLALGINAGSRARLVVGYQQYNTTFERYKKNNLLDRKNLTQHQGNFLCEYTFKSDITLGAAAGVYSVERRDKTMTFIEYVKRTVQVTTGGYGQGQGGGETGKNVVVDTAFTTNTKNSDLSYAGMLYLSKRFNYIVPEISFSYANLSFDQQFQTKLKMTYYPLGNLNFYGMSSVAYIKNKYHTSQIVLTQSFGAKIEKKLWIDARVSVGNHLNYLDNHTFITYNTYDPVKVTADVNLSYYLKKITLSAGYKWMNKQGAFYTNSIFQTYKYNNHLINISLLWDI